MSANNLPIFAEGDYENIQIAVSRGIIDRAAYFFATDLGKIGYIDSDHVIHMDNDKGLSSVQRVKTLPGKDEAKDNIIYIFNDAGYIFNDGIYEPLAKDYSVEIKNIQLEIKTIKQRLNDIVVNGSTNGSKEITEAANVSQFPSIGIENHVYISLSENATYRWDPDSLRYRCTGRDYMNIKQINGGSAEPDTSLI